MALAQKNWFLAEWAVLLGKKQVDFVRDLGWNKSKASLLFGGSQSYSREDVELAAEYLKISPHELLMPPAEAMAIRQLRKAAAAIVASG